ncbi:MAG: conjugal transfer protein [Lachnospiraceae bacterium]
MILKKKKDREIEPKKKLAKKGEKPQPESDPIAESQQKKLKTKEKKVVKKEKDDTYVMKKNTGMKILRALLWIILFFIFFRGVIQIIKPDKVSEISKIINEFKEEQKNNGDHEEELMRYAQDFVKEYLTYTKSGEEEFKKRISPYVSKRVLNISGIYGFRSNAKATYVDAYRKEKYAENIYDVFVAAEVQYDLMDAATGETLEIKERCTLKVPVVVTDNGYAIEALPVYVTDVRRDTDYNSQESVLGSEIDSEPLKSAVTNFLDAYYSQDQSMINYLLAAGADQNKFIGLSKRYTFQKLESIRSYMPVGNDIICLLKVKIQDTVNEEIIYQEYNITMVKEGDRYYIKDMNSKISNINY